MITVFIIIGAAVVLFVALVIAGALLVESFMRGWN